MRFKVVLVMLALCMGVGPMRRAARAFVQERPQAQTAQAGRLAQAKTLFGERCAKCHGANGRGQTNLGETLGVPDFTDSDWWNRGVKDERLANSITRGKGEMPAFGKKLTREEIALLVSYVRRFKRSAR